jgi:SAM-dependent methyltransferase
VTQPGYDALADRYAEVFPGPYQPSIEQHAVAAFVDEINSTGVVVDVGCGIGHVTADLDRRGLDVVGCDPSPAMLAIGRNTCPRLAFLEGDATLAAITGPMAAIIARFSLIHIPHSEVASILRLWADRLRATTPVLIASQSSEMDTAVNDRSLGECVQDKVDVVDGVVEVKRQASSSCPCADRGAGLD